MNFIGFMYARYTIILSEKLQITYFVETEHCVTRHRTTSRYNWLH